MVEIEKYLENPIKRHILLSLINNELLSYSEIYKKLKEDDVENVLFNYHLQHLVKGDILEKLDDGYRMSKSGRSLTANIAPNGLYFPKFTCRYRMYLLDFDNDKVLYQFWNRHPWKGDKSGISSKVLMGTPSANRSQFRMKEKTNLQTNMKPAGTYRKLIFNEQKDLLDDTVYFICYADNFSGELIPGDIDGDSIMWVDFKEAIEFEKTNRNGGQHQVEIIQRLISKDFTPFFFEESITLASF